MESIAQNSLFVQAPGQRIHFGTPGQVTVKSSVETCDLRQIRVTCSSELYDLYRLGRVVGIYSDQLPERAEQLVSNQLRLSEAPPSMNKPVTYRIEAARRVLLIKPTGQFQECCCVIDWSNLPVEQDLAVGISHPQPSRRQTEPDCAAGHNERLTFADAVDGDLEARRPAVDRQD